MDKRNLTLLCDFYEITMANGYFLCGKKDTVAYFDVFFRDIPDGGGFAIAAGLGFWRALLNAMFDITSPFWNFLWGGYRIPPRAEDIR